MGGRGKPQESTKRRAGAAHIYPNLAFLVYSEAIIFMGYETFRRKSKPQLAKHIRFIAKNTVSIFITDHAKKRMKQRKVTSQEVYECLQLGQIAREPEENQEKGSLECLMERYVSGRQLGVIVALCDEDPDAIVVTVFKIS